MNPRLRATRAQIEVFCKKWKIRELALFGSVLREDFDRDSDIDILVSFRPDARWGLWDHSRMEQELSALLGRPVDLITRASVERSANWLRRDAILSSTESVYVEG
ncbi:MAG: nucleotidyltransferase family protein [Thermoplasmatota archaeon]